MAAIVVTKSLAGAEDILRNNDPIVQVRNGANYTVNQVHLPISVSSVANMVSLNPIDGPHVDVVGPRSHTSYVYSASDTSGVTSPFGGSWLKQDYANCEPSYYNRLYSFAVGAILTSPYDALYDENTGKFYRWGGALPKAVSAGSAPVPLGTLAWVDVGQASLRGDISAAFNGSKVCYIETWGDDIAAQIGSAIYPFKTINAAINATTGATTFILGEGLFTWGAVLRDNLSFIGSGQPVPNANSTALVGGTQIQSSDSGGLPGGFTGMSGISFNNLGILAKGKTNGFQLASPGNTAPGKNISVKNITVLCDFLTDHAMLLENLQYLSVENVITYGGVSGCAIKALDFTVSNTVHYDSSSAGLTLRESPYAKCKRGVIDTVRVDRYTSVTNTSAAVQLLNNEESAAMRDITINNVLCNGANTAIFISGQNNTVAAETITITDVTALQVPGFAIYITGNTKNVALRGISTYNCIAIAQLEIFGAYAPTDTLLSGFNDNAGAQSVARPILNDGLRTTIEGFKTNGTGMSTYNPVVENPGTGTTISGFTYTGPAIIDTGAGNHTVIEGEDIQGVPSGPSTPGTCTATKRMNGLMTVNIINAICAGATTDVALPFNMKFKVGNPATPAQIRQNYNIKHSIYINATVPSPQNITATVFPLTESTFRVILSGDPSAIATGVILSAELNGIWK